jgi:crotonobetainyl-CoA:carnitine CoA-transferase CaiB-like acyl-CoA transferase
MVTGEGALDGVQVLDFSTLLPGPLATAILAEAGADVIKLERLDHGDEMRRYEPQIGTSSANFALLNRAKRSIAIDLKSPDAITRLRPLIEQCDVLVEQFRPGVMQRLGLGYTDVRAWNPTIIYCSVSGYAPNGADATRAGHDLNYVADAGLLDLVADGDGNPILPHALIADIGGGAYPAVINILLALLRRHRTGVGAHLEVVMADNVHPFTYWAQATTDATGVPPNRGAELLTGGSPRYALYKTSDGRHLAAAPLEERFWQTFCDVIALPSELRDDSRDPRATREEVASRIAARPAGEWMRRFADVDACCNLVRTFAEVQRDQSDRVLAPDGSTIPALRLPVVSPLRAASAGGDQGYPTLGEDTAKLIGEVEVP